ncbi:hypothetical protein [Microbacterium sp.]|uniref:hypothetical protein n=1 Tax=Microbacterium sp. TaxID=51671 RepID=UPI003C253CCF
MSEFEQPQQSGVSRRTVTKAMAWAVPAIAVAVPAPAFGLASQGIVTLTGRGCKDPGASIPGNPNSKAYYVEVVISNTTANPITVLYTNAIVNGAQPIAPPGFEANPTQTVVAANTTCTVVVRIGNWGDSANATVTLSYTVNGVGGTTNQVTFVSTPPLPGSCVLTYPSSVCVANNV